MDEYGAMVAIWIFAFLEHYSRKFRLTWETDFLYGMSF